MSPKSNLHREELGATFVEATMSIFALIVLIFGLVDFARYVTIKALLVRGARHGLEVAIRIPNLETDTRSNPTSQPPSDFRKAFEGVVVAATSLPLGTLLANPWASSSSPQRLVKFKMIEPAISGAASSAYGRPANGAEARMWPVLVLRPGDKAITNGETIQHPTACASSTTSGCKQIDSESYEKILQKEPIIVEMRAQMRTFTPFLGSINIIGRATGFREVPPSALTPSTANLPVCGDGHVDNTAPFNEECDDPSDVNCNHNCKAIYCGNNRTENDEECDGQDVRPGVTCDASCREIVVPQGCNNNGIQDPGEECDGNYDTCVNCRITHDCSSYPCTPPLSPRDSSYGNCDCYLGGGSG